MAEEQREKRFRIYPVLFLWLLSGLAGATLVILVLLQSTIRNLVFIHIQAEGVAVAQLMGVHFLRQLEGYPREAWTSDEVQRLLRETYTREAIPLGVVWAQMFDGDGNILFSPEPAHVGLNRSAIEARKTTVFQERQEPEVFLLFPEDLGYLQKYITVPVLEVYVPFQDTVHPFQVVEVYLDARPFLTSLRRLQLTIGGILAVTLVVLGGLTFMLTRRADAIIAQQFHALEDAYNRLERLQTFRSNLSNMLAHDLKNHLAALDSGLELLQSLPRDPETQETLTDIRTSVRHAVLMVQNLQDLTRLEDAVLPIEMRSVALRPLLEQVYQSLRVWSEAQTKTCHIAIHPPDLHVRGDAQLLYRVVQNLLHNALKYTPPQGQVWLEAQAQNGKVLLHIRDSGPGIPAEHLPRIFEPFYRVPGRTGGMGLGLAFCKMAVEAMQGRITVVSQEGHGTTFTIELLKGE